MLIGAFSRFFAENCSNFNHFFTEMTATFWADMHRKAPQWNAVYDLWAQKERLKAESRDFVRELRANQRRLGLPVTGLRGAGVAAAGGGPKGAMRGPDRRQLSARILAAKGAGGGRGKRKGGGKAKGAERAQREGMVGGKPASQIRS